MHIIIGTAGSGKTKDLIQKAIDEQLPIFEVDPRKALKIKERAMKYFNQTVLYILLRLLEIIQVKYL